MESTQKQPTCEQRVDEQLTSTLEALRTLWEWYCDGKEEDHPDYGNLYEYGLSFDYVAPNTFKDQEQGYFRYQLSWGGPSDEFRYYVNPDFTAYRVEYWFLDWFDGACRVLRGKDHELLLDIYDTFFFDNGTVEHAYMEATQ